MNALLSVIGALVAAVLAYIIYDHYRAMIWIRSPRTVRSPLVNRFVDLYEQLIPEHERIDSAEVCRWIGRKNYYVRSGRKLRRLPDNAETQHLLLLAVNDRQLVGFLVLLFPVSHAMAFIAYMGSIKGPMADQPSITRRLVKRAFRIIKKCDQRISWITFELDPPISKNNRSMAKLTTFRHHAEPLGAHVKVLDTPYIQPAMTVSEETEMATEINAQLGIVGLNALPTELGGEAVQDLIRTIYREVYGHSVDTHADPDAYSDYLCRLSDLVCAMTPQTVRLI